jgi:hypothetical protein
MSRACDVLALTKKECTVGSYSNICSISLNKAKSLMLKKQQEQKLLAKPQHSMREQF